MKRLIVISLVFLPICASAQFNIEFQTGYASYSMSGLKDYQESLRNNYPPQAIITESFKPFWYQGVNAKWTYKQLHLGMSVSFGSTGGQVYYSDYSGTQSQQQLFKYTSVNSIAAAKWSFNDDRTIITFDPRVGLVFGKLTVNDSYHVNGDLVIHYDQTIHYKSSYLSLEPTVSIFQRFGIFGVTAFAGYHLGLTPAPFRRENGSTSTGLNSNTNMDLAGYRVGGAVGLYFKRTGESEYTRLYIGPGMGLDYGGFGLNFMLMATRYAGFFASLGTNLDGPASNAGIRLYTKDDKAKIRPYFALMYGYNAVVYIKNAKDYNRTFYGATIAFGADVRVLEKNFVNIGLGIPFRGSDVRNYINGLKAGGVHFERELLPVTISLGYRLPLD